MSKYVRDKNYKFKFLKPFLNNKKICTNLFYINYAGFKTISTRNWTNK